MTTFIVAEETPEDDCSLQENNTTPSDKNVPNENENDKYIDKCTDKNIKAQQLYSAIQINDTETALKLLEDESDNIYDSASRLLQQIHNAKTKWTALHWASHHGNEKLVEALLSHNAASQYHTHKAKNNLRGGPQRHDPITMNTPLHRAAQRGHLGVVWLLLLSSFSPNDVDNVGNTPLHLAAANGHERVVKCLLEDGADERVENRFRLTPYYVANGGPCRVLLRGAALVTTSGGDDRVGDEGEATTSRTDADLRRQRHRERYVTVEGDICRDTEISSKDKLKHSLECGKRVGVVTEVLEQGYRRVAYLELVERLTEDLSNLKDNCPVTTPTQYRLIRSLSKTVRTVERMVPPPPSPSPYRLSQHHHVTTPPDSSNTITPASVSQLIDEARSLCTASHHDYWLQTSINRLSRVTCATERTATDMTRLADALRRAEEVPGCDEEIISRARTLHARLSSETMLKEARTTLPTVKLPPPPEAEMTAKELKEYWAGEEDCGWIEQTEGFPLPPEETGEYVWMPSRALTKLRNAMETVDDAIQRAQENGANEELVNDCKEVMDTKRREKDLLEVKDEEDRVLAIADATKMAKKLKKKKKGKKGK